MTKEPSTSSPPAPSWEDGIMGIASSGAPALGGLQKENQETISKETTIRLLSFPLSQVLRVETLFLKGTLGPSLER